ncbi:MAG: glutamine amidotransferase [Blautia sp.]|nr:glutamine amidotransferase [Blautia sp.]
MYELRICHLYPDVLNLYGDRGNILCMQRRLQWRGIQANVTGVSVGDPLNVNDYDLFFIGGGQDFEQEVLLQDLAKGKAQQIRNAVEEEKTFLAICGGYQMLGNYYKTWDGHQCDFIGAVDLYTIGGRKRMIGNYMYRMDEQDGGMTIVGFENHSGRTYLGEGVRPMGKILAGYGNNGKDQTEGARYKNVFATYSHGPVLPKNPLLADRILRTALRYKYPNLELEPLEDKYENAAHQDMQRRMKQKGASAH